MEIPRSYVSTGGAVRVLLIAALVLLGTSGFSVTRAAIGGATLTSTPFTYTPFTVDLPIPSDVQPGAPFTAQCTLPDLPGMLPAKFYEVRMRKAVFVVLGNGFFEPRSVETRRRFGDRVEIIRGIEAGEAIVVSANFLVDSESQMKLAAARMGGTSHKTLLCQTQAGEVQNDHCGHGGHSQHGGGHHHH